MSISSSGIIVEELDDTTFDVIDVKYYGFTTKKKLEQNNILYYNNKNFNNDYAKYTWMQENILNWLDKCFYVAIEDYAFGTSSSSGMIFSLAEFEGNIKIGLYNKGKKLRFYSVNSNKKFFTGYGLSDKIGMYQAFNKYTGVKPDISTLPIVDSGKGVAPTSDIIDAFALCECLRMELKLRAGLVQLHELPKHQIEVYNVITREHPQGLLVAPFIEK